MLIRCSLRLPVGFDKVAGPGEKPLRLGSPRLAGWPLRASARISMAANKAVEYPECALGRVAAPPPRRDW